MKLAGNKAIVTGCSRGLGHVVAQALWREGADLLLVARSEARLRALAGLLPADAPGGAGQQAHAFAADLRDPDAPRAILAEARRLWPRLDVLVNSAAIGGPIGPLADNDWGAWRDTIQVNLLAPAELCQRSIAWMRETGGGRIVNLSGGGAASPRPNFSAYAAAKCALVRLTETIAAETAELGIRVNAVAPGAMDTEMRREALASGLERAGSTADPRTAAELIVYLASEESAGITGKLISAVWDPWRTLHQHAADLAGTDVYTLRRILPEERGKAWSGE
ncbi:MAG TPA: SDR family oxidoreductase [Bryobacteraceae bacterium]|nr:SDR family oxidoreductase [Bryobacteraceae bacterium]